MNGELDFRDPRINQQAWDEWEKWRRKELRKKITPRAKKRQQAMLAEYSFEEQARILNHSMDNDYQGLFPEKVVGRGGRPAENRSTRHLSLEQDLGDRSWAK